MSALSVGNPLGPAPLAGWPNDGCDRQLTTYGYGGEVAQHELALSGVAERPGPVVVPVLRLAQVRGDVAPCLFAARRAVIALGGPEGCAETAADL